MAQTVLHIFDHLFTYAHVGEHHRSQFAIRGLVTAADVVDLADRSLTKNGIDASAIVENMNPVPNVQTISLQRNFLSVEQVRHKQRNDLFGELKWTEVVR